MELHTSMIPWIPILSLIIYIPFLCYLDWKHRDIKTHALWLPLLAINIPVLISGYLIGLYPSIMLLVTMLISFAWFLMLYHRGADCVYLICITMFAVINPATGSNFIQVFLIYLIIFTAATYWGIWLDNRIRTHINSFDMENGIPFLIPISVALLASVVVA